MDRLKIGIRYTALLLVVLITVGCDSDSNPNNNPTSFAYSTTSSVGDYSEWTLTGSGLTATLNVVSGTGVIDYTYNITANCAGADSFGVRSCTLVTSSCTAGASVCPPGSFAASFEIMDAPGVALFVNTGTQLHVGFAKDSTACAQDVSGDYTMIHTGLGLNENFGLYRSDSNFINILHADFGFTTPDANVTQVVAYTTGTESEALTDGGCVDGVRTRTLPGPGGAIARSMMTNSGLFVLDLPSGQGGLLSFKVANAATLADFASKSFGGISFPDNAAAEPVRADFGPVVGTSVGFTATTPGGVTSLDLIALATPAMATSPSYPSFTVAPAGYGASVLFGSYASPSAIPGLFKIDDPVDAGRVIIAAMKFSSKVIAVGMVYNYRTTADINPSTGLNFAADGLYNTGNFLLFER